MDFECISTSLKDGIIMQNSSIAKGCSATILMVVCGIIALIALFGFLITLSPNLYNTGGNVNFAMMWAAIFIGDFIICFWIAFKIRKIGFKDMNNWLKSKSFCHHTYAFDASGIALDEKNCAIYLICYEKKHLIEKKYSFDDIRNWRYEVYEPNAFAAVSKGSMFNTLIEGSSVMANIVDSAASTGLTIEVKDINYPSWFIKFKSDKTVEAELKRWMEIFQQCINESANDTMSQEDTADIIDSIVLCPKCGFANISGTKYCGNCGNKLIQKSTTGICPNCGSQIPSNSSFCSSCGTKIN
jgi:hypothetical protein